MYTRLSRPMFALAFVLAIVLSGAGIYVYAQPSRTATAAMPTAIVRPTYVPAPTLLPTPQGEEERLDAERQIATEPFIRSELYFGSERPNKPEVSDVEFKQFLDEVVTPRFPDGLTVLKGFGQFRESNGMIVQESSFVLIVLYPKDSLRESSAKIEEIRALYLKRFEQESVLRVDDPRPVRVSF